MPNLFKKLHLPAVIAFAGQLIGLTDLVAQNPKIATEIAVPHLGLSPEWATVLVGACTLVQAVSRAVHKGNVVEVPKGH